MKRFLLLLLLSVPVFLLAQSAMSLDDCIRLAYKQNPAVRNGVIGIKETKADYIASVGAFLPHIVVNAETGKRFGRSLDPDTNGYTSESFEEGTVGLDMTLSLFEGFSRINQVRFRKMNKERSEWELKEKQNELAYQVTDAYYKLILERKLLDLALEQSRLSERYLKQTEVFVELGLKSASDLQEVKARREGDIYRYQSRGNSSRIALLHLKQLMNIQPGDTLAILDTITASQVPPYSVSTVETLYAQSIEILPSIRMIDLKQKAAHKEYAIAGGAFSPSVFARFTVGSNYYNTAFSARQLRDNIGKYVGVGISFPLLSGLQRLTNQRKLKLNMYRLKNEEELEKQQLYTDIEQWVAKTQNHITGLYHSSLFFQALFHTTALDGIHIDNPARHDLTNHTDIITELGLLDSSNCQPVFLHCHRRSCISENKIGNHSKSEHYPTDPIKTFAIDAGFSFNKCIHNGL